MDDIKIKKNNLSEETHQTIDYYLKISWQSIVNKYNQIAIQFDLTQATGYLLLNIAKEGTAVSQLARLLGVKATSLSRILRTLEESGLIYREIDQTDKRFVNVFLTPMGLEKRQIAKTVVKDFNNYLDHHISLEERQRLIEGLIRMNAVVESYSPIHDTELEPA